MCVTSTRRFSLPIPLQKTAWCVLAVLLVLPVTLSFPRSAYATTCGTYGGIIYTDVGSGQCRGFITSGTTWTVPTDWTSVNTIETIGGGGAGGSENSTNGNGASGGGGEYRVVTNVSYTPGNSITIQVGQGRTRVSDANGNSGTATFIFNDSNSSVVASSSAGKGGLRGGASQAGGAGGTGGTGGSENHGGAGGNTSSTPVSGGSGGGAGGPKRSTPALCLKT